MLNMCILTGVMLFCVIGIYFVVREVSSAILKNSGKCYVIMDITNQTSGIEGAVRSAAAANPDSDIILVDHCKNGENKRIMQRLEKESSRIHIYDKYPPS